MKINPCPLLFLFPILLPASCMKCDPYSRSCDLSSGKTTLTQNSTVVYKVFSTGSVYINTLSYHDLKGKVTIDKPTLPFSTTVTGTAGTETGLEVNGMAMEGTIYLEQAIVTGTDTAFTKDHCGN